MTITTPTPTTKTTTTTKSKTTHLNNNHILYFIFLILISVPTKSEAILQWQPPSNSIYEILESNGLPSGLFPKGVTNFTVGDDGSFEVYLDQPCDAKFESELHYEKNVVGQLSVGQIGNLSGISAQDLFLWFPVKGIRVDIPSSGVIYFDVGVVRKQFSVSLFETPRDCVATKLPVGVVFHRSYAIVDGLKKLGGMLRYSMNWWWRNEGEIM